MASVWRQRVDGADWDAVTADINDVGGALLPELIAPDECASVIDLYSDDSLFRATIDMGRHRYGQGEYRYFARPYPPPIEELKQALYPRLLPIAHDWWVKLDREAPWPNALDEWLDMCHRVDQTKPTALMLKYGPGDWNALHRDLYGELIFPLQVRPVRTAPWWSWTCPTSCDRQPRCGNSPRIRSPDDVLERILDNARFAPTGGNRQGVRIVVLRDKDTRSALADLGLPAARRYTAQLTHGEAPWNPLQPTAVAVSDIEKTEAPAQMSAPLRDAQVVLVVCLDLGVVAATDQDLDRIAVVPGASVYPFVWNILLAARNEGYGGVLTTMVVAEEPRVKSLLGVPDSYAIAAVVPLGKPVHQVTKLRRRPVLSSPPARASTDRRLPADQSGVRVWTISSQ